MLAQHARSLPGNDSGCAQVGSIKCCGFVTVLALALASLRHHGSMLGSPAARGRCLRSKPKLPGKPRPHPTRSLEASESQAPCAVPRPTADLGDALRKPHRSIECSASEPSRSRCISEHFGPSEEILGAKCCRKERRGGKQSLSEKLCGQSKTS